MGAPSGNQNASKKKRMMTDALRRELTQKPEDVLAIVLKTIEDAKNGDLSARALVFERLDGKVPQAIVGDYDEDPIQLEKIVREIVRPNPQSSNG